ncbi:polysaccharide deacetylase family protein [Ruminococcus gauvreauii]|uniref:Polysaccharide deacetylase family protein n=1 Tax=Ruminococcus gauvreauii TaxID=438033 RepID=A0ABY5VC04_9FIRM|nr:polysaccharide deacetylase family protein [Ruminococcus gauvreauii]UWP58039.1 polysaccharide deacetylase family protein [Ruminococcus gauvreauii]
MDERQRRERIERMRREKERQLRRRRRQKMLIKRCVAVAACVAVVLLCISAVWAVVKPMVKNSDTSGKTDKAVMEVEAGTEEEAETGETGGDAAAGDGSDGQAPQENTDQTGADIPAVKTGMAADTVTNYAVPGWQVDDNGWWYANEDRTYYKNGWLEIDGQNYYFNADGYMQTGWAVIGNKGCYFNENGVYEPDKESKMIALTFDDGPGKYTSELLDILEANGAKATFFMLGECIDEYGADTIPRMKELGCELGNHSFSHPNLKSLDEAGIKDQFDRTDQAIAQYAGGDVATLARTPFGSQDETITGAIGKPCIYWSLDTLDWETKNVDSNIAAVLDNVSDGEIVLMHDIWPTTVESCKTIIPKLVEQGYQLVTVSELAAAKGVSMEDGVTYYDFYPGKDATAGGADSDEDQEVTDESEPAA